MGNIQYLNLAEVDRMARSARAADQAYQMNQAKFSDYLRQRDQQQTADTLYRSAGGDPGLAAEMAAREPGASYTTSKDLQDRAATAEDRRAERQPDARSSRKGWTEPGWSPLGFEVVAED